MLFQIASQFGKETIKGAKGSTIAHGMNVPLIASWPGVTPPGKVNGDLIDSAEFRRAARILPVVLGRNLEGDEVVDDLTKMPHLLIAGATGSGKSVSSLAIMDLLPPNATVTGSARLNGRGTSSYEGEVIGRGGTAMPNRFSIASI